MRKLVYLSMFLFILIPAKAQTLHLLMVSDYSNATFGKVTLENEVNIEEMFSTVSYNLNYKINKIYLNTTNKLFNRTGIITQLNNLKTLPEDIIVFYYGGFSFYPPQSKSEYPTFSLKNTDNKTLSMDDISNQLSLKNNRLGVVIADIRNTENKIIGTIPESGMVATEQLSKIITQKIFLEQSGVCKILSAKKGVPSYPYFTTSFVYAFNRILENSDGEDIRQMSFDNVLSSTQTRINSYVYFSEVKIPQEIKWLFTNLNKKVKSYQPPVLNIPTPKELKAQLELLINPINTTERSKIESNIRALFTPDANIIVQAISVNSPQTESMPTKMTINEYLKQTAGYDAKVKRSLEDFNVFDFRRTPDFKKFYELRITEKIN